MEEEAIIEICQQYGFTPSQIEIVRNEERVLAKITSDKQYYLKGEPVVNDYWERCCVFARILLAKGMPVTNYNKTKAGKFTVEYGDKVFSLEESLEGEAIESLTDEDISEIGRLLGVQHALSLDISSPFNSATSWSMFGGNKTDNIGDYDENELSFLEFKQKYGNHALFAEIETLYQTHRQKLYKVWKDLPQGAVQGDFCYYNMLRAQNGSLAIYDFNLAGNEVYLNESIAVGVYHAWHAPYKGNLEAEGRFQLFLAAYLGERAFNQLEQVYHLNLKAIIRAFRYDRIDVGVALQDESAQMRFMQETLAILKVV